MGADLVVIGMLAVMLLGLGLRAATLPRGRLGDGVRPRSIPVLVIAAAIFGALAVGMIVYGVLELREPMKIVDVRWMGLADLRLHAWPLAVVALVLGLLMLVVPASLLARLRDVLRERTVEVAPPEEPSFYRASLARAAAAAPATSTAAPASVLRPARSAEQIRRDTLAALDRLSSAPDPLAFLAAAARDVAPQLEQGAHAAALRAILADLDAARFGGAATDPAALAARLRSLLG